MKGNGLLNKLVAYWSCNEESGDRLDSHTGGHDLTEVGSVLSAMGKHANGLDPGLLAINHLDGPTGGPFGFGDKSFSVNGWVRVISGADLLDHPVAAKWDSSAIPDVDDCWLLWFRTLTGEFRFSISSDGTSEESFVETTDFATSSSLQMVSAGYNADDNEIWIARNAGQRITEPHTGGAFADSSAPVTLAWFQGTVPVMGSEPIDEVAIWSRYLTDGDLSSLYKGSSGLFFSSFTGGTALAPGHFARASSYYFKKG